ncbi:MAG: TetR/AcrR family transcriptional regulator [Bacteroidales bacterium]|nr:TetR/AcrR family transcriptional regulator [Bacteroidales bacterium]TFH47902.1 MAG: TetR/AcrR family transcriptional regulator [Bacteroidia bacterium]
MNTVECDERIVTEAAELFRLYGIKAVTMDTLAQHMGISKRTIYEKFKDKDELLMAVMNCMMLKQREKIENLLETSPNVIVAVFRMIGVMREHAGAMNPLIHSDLRKYHSSVLKRMKEKCEYPDYKSPEHIIVKGKDQKLFRAEINNEIVSRSFEGLGPLMTDSNLFPPEKFSQRDVIKNVIVNYLRGISTREGQEIIDKLEPEL